jgi:hypothetical protein
MGGKGVRNTRRQYVTSRKTWMLASARAQNSNGELTVPGWEGGPQHSAAIRDFAQDVDVSFRKGAKLERRINRSWAGRGSAKRGGDARRDFTWGVDGNQYR